MSSKQEVLAAAAAKFATKQVFLDDAKMVSVSVRELSRPEREALERRLFVCDEATGKPITINAAGDPDPAGQDWKYRDGVSFLDEWLSATMSPSFTVEELRGPEWPASLKRAIYDEAASLNGMTVKVAAGN